MIDYDSFQKSTFYAAKHRLQASLPYHRTTFRNDRNGLENRRCASIPGFKSLTLRHSEAEKGNVKVTVFSLKQKSSLDEGSLIFS